MSLTIVEARYTSPSGKEAVFLFESVSRETELKTGIFTFPNRDGAHVQHQGMGARSFPLTCIFSGAACMDEADAFEDMLIEPGVGELQHPVYGVIKVVPTGNITREDDLVSRMNESIVTVTFTETITDEQALQLETVAADDIDKKFEEFSDAAAEYFANSLSDQSIEQSATQWEGEAAVTVTEPGSTLPAGTELKSVTTGNRYVTEENVVLENETETVPIRCTEAGSGGNIEIGDSLEFVSTPEGVKDIATVESVTAYGEDITSFDNKSISEQLQIQSSLTMQTQSIVDNLQSIAMTDKKTFADWLATVKEVKDNIKNLYKKAKNVAGKVENTYIKALNIARGVLRLMKLPSRIAVSLSEKIKGYSKLTADLINQYRNDPFGVKNIVNAYNTAILGVFAAVASIASGSAVTVSKSTKSREEAVESARTVQQLFDDMQTFQDTKITQIEGAGESTFEVTQIIEETVDSENAALTQLEEIAAVAPPSVKSLIEEIILFKQEKVIELQSVTGKPASRTIDILNNIIVFERDTITRLEVLLDQSAREVVQIIQESIDIKQDQIDALQNAVGNIDNTFVDTNSETFLLLSELLYTSVQLILNASFALPMQRTITLDRDRQVIELCAELYGSVDPEIIDQFIMENNFNLDEIQLIPMGRKVSYYVKSA